MSELTRFKKTAVRIAVNVPEPRLKKVDAYSFEAPEWLPLKLCVHKDPDNNAKWTASETATGFRVSFSWPTRQEAAHDAIETLERKGRALALERLRIGLARRKEMEAARKTPETFPLC